MRMGGREKMRMRMGGGGGEMNYGERKSQKEKGEKNIINKTGMGLKRKKTMVEDYKQWRRRNKN